MTRFGDWTDHYIPNLIRLYAGVLALLVLIGGPLWLLGYGMYRLALVLGIRP